MRKRLACLLACFSLAPVSACTGIHACTEIGCEDTFTLNFSLPSGEKPNISVDLLIDGSAASCPALGSQPSVTCASKITSTMLQGETCTESRQGNAVTHSCVGNGIYHVAIVVSGTPKSVSYSAKVNGTVVAQDTARPVFQALFPNGPGCGSACMQAHADVTLATP